MRSLGLAALAFLVVGLAFASGYASAMATAATQRTATTMPPSLAPGTVENLPVFWEAWDLLKTHYYGELPPADQLTPAALRGVVNSLGDPHTAYVDSLHASIFQQDLEGNFEGIGATVRINEQGQLVIVAPLEESPAERAGLLPGDIVLSADGVPIKNMTVLEAVGLIRGPRGTTVRLMVQHPGESTTFEVAIVRERINVAVVQFEMKGDDSGSDNIAYVKLTDFSANAPEQLKNALEKLLEQEPKGLILDLRNNPGGFLQVAVNITGQFVPHEVILIERDKEGNERRHRSSRSGIAADIPLVVLVNKGSASASEILAGAIQDHGRGVLIGETTFGKGSVQLSHTLSDGSSLRVTTAHWFTPLDREINGTGIEPDIVATRTAEDVRTGQDPQLDRAIEYLRRGK